VCWTAVPLRRLRTTPEDIPLHPLQRGNLSNSPWEYIYEWPRSRRIVAKLSAFVLSTLLKWHDSDPFIVEGASFTNVGCPGAQERVGAATRMEVAAFRNQDDVPALPGIVANSDDD